MSLVRYLFCWKVRHEKEHASARLEVLHHLDHVCRLEMLHGVAAEDEVELLRDGVGHQVVHLKPPGLGLAEVVTVSLNGPRHNVVASEVDVGSSGEKTRHPGHITT